MSTVIMSASVVRSISLSKLLLRCGSCRCFIGSVSSAPAGWTYLSGCKESNKALHWKNIWRCSHWATRSKRNFNFFVSLFGLFYLFVWLDMNDGTRKKVVFCCCVLQNKIQRFSKVLSNIKLFLLSLPVSFSHTHEVIYAFKATEHLFHCRWTEFSFAEIGQTEALTQIELKRLNVFNSLLGAVHKINPILPLSNSRPQWSFSRICRKRWRSWSRVRLSSFYVMLLWR